MGLDMFLYAKRHLNDWNEVDVAKADQIRELFPELPVPVEDISRAMIVQTQIGYWRKANHIHKWMVDNVQDGKDDCKYYSFYSDQRSALRAVCEAVLADHTKAPSMLPTQSGFFYGDSQYGEWYFHDVQKTIGILDRCDSLDDESWEFEYTSSW
jgi:hypothetical protein